MGSMASQITSLTIVYSAVYLGADQRKHQSSASLAFVWGFHRGPVNSPHKWPVTRKMFPFDVVIMHSLRDNCRIEHPLCSFIVIIIAIIITIIIITIIITIIIITILSPSLSLSSSSSSSAAAAASSSVPFAPWTLDCVHACMSVETHLKLKSPENPSAYKLFDFILPGGVLNSTTEVDNIAYSVFSNPYVP